MLLMDYSTPPHARRRQRESVSLMLYEMTALEGDHGSIIQETTVLEEVHDSIIPEKTVLEEVLNSIIQETTASAEVQDDSNLQLELLLRLMHTGLP
jgi:hypothetical protein